MSAKAGQLLWNRQRITLQPGTTQHNTGLQQTLLSMDPPLGISIASPGPSDGTLPASRVMVLPEAPLEPWVSGLVTTGEPYLNPATGTVWVTFNVTLGPVTINVLFWDPATIVGSGSADAYNPPSFNRDCTDTPNQVAIDALNNDLVLWGADIGQHCFFQSFGLNASSDAARSPVPGGFQDRALTLSNAWAVYNALPPVPGDPGDIADALTLLNGPTGTIQFNIDVLAAQAAGTWTGWMYPAVIQHMLDEAVYFRDSLTGAVRTTDQLRQIWFDFQADHASFVVHLLDPTETTAMGQALQFQREFQTLQTKASAPTYDCQYDTIGEAMNASYNAYLTGLNIGGVGGAKSIMNGYLIGHMIGEGNSTTAILQALGCTCP